MKKVALILLVITQVLNGSQTESIQQAELANTEQRTQLTAWFAGHKQELINHIAQHRESQNSIDLNDISNNDEQIDINATIRTSLDQGIIGRIVSNFYLTKTRTLASQVGHVAVMGFADDNLKKTNIEAINIVYSIKFTNQRIIVRMP